MHDIPHLSHRGLLPRRPTSTYPTSIQRGRIVHAPLPGSIQTAPAISPRQDKLPLLREAGAGGIYRWSCEVTSENLPVRRKICGRWHDAATDIVGCLRLFPILPCFFCHLTSTGLLGPGGFKGRRIGGRQLARDGPLRGGANPCGLQGRGGAACRCPLLSRMSKRGSGGLFHPRRGGLNR